MVDKVKRKRVQKKCSECRKQRVKCDPCDRNWGENQQKCDRCTSRGLDCGPNIRKKDDAEANLSYDKQDSSEAARSSLTQQSTLQSLPEDYVLQDDPGIGTSSHEGRKGKKTLGGHSNAATSEEIREKLRSKFKRLNAMGIFSIHASVAPTHCGAPHTTKTISSKFKEEFHTLFIKIFHMILELDSQGKQDLASGQMNKLLLDLQKYRPLCDDQKRVALLDMAEFFKKHGDRDEYDYVLEILVDITEPSILPIDQDPCHLLAESFLESDDKGLSKFWGNHLHFAKSNMPSDPIIPPPQRAAQLRNPKIAEIVSSRNNSIHRAPTIFNLESVHIAAALGNVDTLSILIKMMDGKIVNARDDQMQTPLFLAAAHGREDCCRLLLQHNADPNARDGHGHTILEVASKRGNLNIVKMLVEANADLKDYVAGCGSTVLQAAIESGDPSGELVTYILSQGVDVSAQRIYDKETAISLAEGRGLDQLAQDMRSIMARQQGQREPSYFPNQFAMGWFPEHEENEPAPTLAYPWA